jgi:hypothetical protein
MGAFVKHSSTTISLDDTLRDPTIRGVVFPSSQRFSAITAKVQCPSKLSMGNAEVPKDCASPLLKDDTDLECETQCLELHQSLIKRGERICFR